MELKINIAIQGVLHYLITNFVATETLVMGLSNNYSLKIANTFKHGELNNRGTSTRPCTLVNKNYLEIFMPKASIGFAMSTVDINADHLLDSSTHSGTPLKRPATIGTRDLAVIEGWS